MEARLAGAHSEVLLPILRPNTGTRQPKLQHAASRATRRSATVVKIDAKDRLVSGTGTKTAYKMRWNAKAESSV